MCELGDTLFPPWPQKSWAGQTRVGLSLTRRLRGQWVALSSSVCS